MAQFVILEKKFLDRFIAVISAKKKVVAPVARGLGHFSFQPVKTGSEISLKYIPTILPPKKYFMPIKETLVEYDVSNGQDCRTLVELEELILFGVHTCDLAGIQCLNIVFSDGQKDQNYLLRKNKIIIIGLECNEYCDEHASCALVDHHLPNGGYDLFFTELNDCFLAHINTLEGAKIVEMSRLFQAARPAHLEELEKMREQKRQLFIHEVNIEPEELHALFDHCEQSKVWEDLDRRCVACANCTTVCPTCYCFDVDDEAGLDVSKGLRCRKWDSCQNEAFAKVAGGHNFRKTRGSRQKHRYFRKFKYPIDRYSRFFCTGCGRCTRACMAGIDLKETLNALIQERTLA